MAMTFTSLTAPKTTPGSIANWVNYTRLDIDSILDEAQSLIYQLLRVREMESMWSFRVAAGDCSVALPADYLDPNGPLLAPSHMIRMFGQSKSIVEQGRSYEEVAETSFATDPFTTTLNSKLVAVALVGHGLTAGSVATIAGADAVGGLTLNGTFPIVSRTSADAFVIDAGAPATSAATGGGLIATISASKLISGFPSVWAVYEERLQFDVAFEEAMRFRLPCFRAPALLSAANPSNFLTTRYPNVLRKACLAAAADFNEDTAEYTKHKGDLVSLVGTVVASQDDLKFRGSDIMTDTP